MSSFLDSTGLSHLIEKIKAAFVLKGDTTPATTIGIDSTPTASSTNLVTSGGAYTAINKAFAKIPFAEVDSTSTSTVFTATVPGITAYEDGTCVMLRNGIVTSASGFTVNINNLGAKPVYTNLAASTRDTTIFNINYTMLFVYDSDRVSDGCWICYRGYDSNSNTIGYELRTDSSTKPMKDITYRYRLLFTSADGLGWVPANTSTSTNATAKRNVNQTPIDPFGEIVYYQTTAVVAVGEKPAATYLWQQRDVGLGYSFNHTGAALTLTVDTPVYIKCAPQSNGSAIIDSDTPYTQALPAAEDGKIYIYLGMAVSATTVEMTMKHPIYYFKDGAIRAWTGSSADENISRVESVTETALSDLEKKHQRNVKRIEDLEDGFEAVYDDIERVESAIPTVPTNVSAFTNDAGYLVDHNGVIFTSSVSTTIVDAQQSHSYINVNPTGITLSTSSATNGGNVVIQTPVGMGLMVNGNLVQNKVGIISASGTSLTAAENTYYRFDSEVNTLAVTLPAITSNTYAVSIILNFTTGTTPALTITSANSTPIAYYDGYSIDADTTYELNIMYNGSKWIVAYGIIE